MVALALKRVEEYIMTQLDARGETHIVAPAALHNDDGTLALKGYAFSLLPRYDRARVKAAKFRIKEWDYYLVNDDEYALALTLSDLGYIGMISASVIDFTACEYTTTSEITVLPLGRFNMPSDSSRGESTFENKRVKMSFIATPEQRALHCEFKKFKGDLTLTADVVLDEIPRDTMVISTPFAEDPKAFYFNQKIDAMRATGVFTVGDVTHEFSPRDSFGLLDWGRGVWTYDNIWYWGLAQGWQNGRGEAGPDAPGAKRFGMNIGYGFGDTSAASENMCFIDGEAVKLGRLDFGIPENAGKQGAKRLLERYRFMEPWHIRDTEGRLDLRFTPQIDRFDLTDAKLIVTDQHQVFGTFDGSLVLDDGSVFQIAGLRGAAEAVHNKY